MKFEKLYMTYLAEKLRAKGLKIIESLDKQYDILFNDINEVSFIMKTGDAVKTLVPNYDLNTIPITINFTCLANSSEHVLTVLSNLCEEEAKLINPSLDGISYRAVFSTPSIIGSPFDIQTKNSTKQIVNIVMLINITYSTNALITLPNLKLEILNKTYDINYIVNYSMAYNPVYNGYQKENNNRMTYTKIADVNTYVITVYKVLNDELQKLLMEELLPNANEEDTTFINDITLLVDGKDIPIRQHNVALNYENAISSLVITLVA